jgi:hypothetical protein
MTGVRKARVVGAAVAVLISVGSSTWAQTGQPGGPGAQAPWPGMMGPGMMGQWMGPGMMGWDHMMMPMMRGPMGPMMGWDGRMPMMGWDQMPMMRGPMGPMMGWDGRMPMMMGPGVAGPGVMAQHVEGRLAFLRAELGITEAQAPQWDAFAEAFRANARGMAEIHQQMMPMMFPGPQLVPLPRGLELHEQMMVSRLEALRRLKAAAGPLYDALDERQKRIADGLVMGMM